MVSKSPADNEEFDLDFPELDLDRFEDDSESLGRALNNSRPLDVHRWSDYREVKELTASIYEEIVANLKTQNPKARPHKESWQKHLKVLLIDLYHLHLTNPDGFIGYSRARDKYVKNSRYNKLHLTYSPLVKMVDGLLACGYIEHFMGVNYKGYKRNSRMQPTEKLIKAFYQSHIKPEHIGSVDKEPIELKDKDKNRVDYKRAPKEINDARKDIIRYNKALDKSYIDIALDMRLVELATPFDLSNKHVKRVYNDSKWDNGGRFYGGWYQQVPSSLRRFILIDGEPTVELDYRGIHLVLLYAQKGMHPNELGDPYKYNGKEVKDPEFRNLLKSLLIYLLNAKTESAAIKALRMELRDHPEQYPPKDDIPDLKELVAEFKKEHHLIADKFGSNIGVKLQNLDSKMANSVMISMLTLGNDAIALCIHDSFICKASHEALLGQLMQSAITEMVRSFSDVPESMHTEIIEGAVTRQVSWVTEKNKELCYWLPQIKRQRAWEDTGTCTFYEFEGVFFKKAKDKQSRKDHSIIKSEDLKRLLKRIDKELEPDFKQEEWFLKNSPRLGEIRQKQMDEYSEKLLKMFESILKKNKRLKPEGWTFSPEQLEGRKFKQTDLKGRVLGTIKTLTGS